MSLELKFAGVIGLVSFFVLLLEYWLGFQGKYIEYALVFGTISYLVPIIGILLGIRAKRNIDLGGRMTFKEGVRMGLAILMMFVILNALLQMIFYRFIHPEYFEKMIDYIVNRSSNLGLDTENIRLNARANFNLISVLVTNTTTTLALGTIISLIGGLIFQKK